MSTEPKENKCRPFKYW